MKNNKLKTIDNKHMKAYVYVREFDFTSLSDADAILYDIEQKNYKYVGFSTEKSFRARTAKWVYKNINKKNDIGKLLNKIKNMLNDSLDSISLNEYVEQNSRILNYYDTIEQAKAIEKSLIGVLQYEQYIYKLNVECLNKYDKPLEISDSGYKLRSNILK